MMLRLLVMMVALSALNQPAHAQSKAQISANIKTLEARLDSKQEGIVTLNRRLESYQERLDDAQEKLDKAKADLFEANNAVITAKQATGNDAATQQELAKKKLDLAHNALESRQSRLEMTASKQAALEASLVKTKNEVAQLQGQLIELNKQLKLAQAQPQPQAKPQPAPKPVQTSVAAAPQPVPMPELASAAPVAVAEPEPSPVATLTPAAELTPEQKSARAAMRALNEKVRGADLDGYRQFGEIYVRHDTGREELEFLGNAQYYAEVVLPRGSNRLKIQSRSFRVDVPDDQHNNTFAIIYDATNRQKADFSIFNKSLIED